MLGMAVSQLAKQENKDAEYTEFVGYVMPNAPNGEGGAARALE